MCCDKRMATSTSTSTSFVWIDVDVDVDPHERRLEIRDAANGWPLIDLSIEAAGFLLVTTLGPTRNAMLDSIGRALSEIGAPWRIDDA